MKSGTDRGVQATESEATGTIYVGVRTKEHGCAKSCKDVSFGHMFRLHPSVKISNNVACGLDTSRAHGVMWY